VRAGRFFIYGAHDRGLAPPNAINLRIEAGAAFGTGHHGTTVGCLLAYDRLLKRGAFERVLDVGCGTGRLAIAAARTGSTVAVGTDIDGRLGRIANENARSTAPRAVRARRGLDHPLVREGGPYELVFANILARPLIDAAPRTSRRQPPAWRLRHPVGACSAPRRGGDRRLCLPGLQRLVRAAPTTTPDEPWSCQRPDTEPGLAGGTVH
jgi:ribosomal protein L11 methylase PrmA